LENSESITEIWKVLKCDAGEGSPTYNKSKEG
jgi:hypothetical protein